MKFADYNKKIKVFRQLRKLKDTQITIAGDYSEIIMRGRRLLWKSAKSERENGSKVQLFYDRPQVDDVKYFWDDQKNSRVKINETVTNKKARRQ